MGNGFVDECAHLPSSNIQHFHAEAFCAHRVSPLVKSFKSHFPPPHLSSMEGSETEYFSSSSSLITRPSRLQMNETSGAPLASQVKLAV